MTSRENIPWQLTSMRYGFRVLDALAPALVGNVALTLFTHPLRRRLAEQDLLAQAESVTIPFRGQSLRAYAWGRGPLVLLVHGWETDAGTMTGFVAPLVAAGFRAVALDGPAHGRSPGRNADLLVFSAAIQAAVTQLGPAAGVVAHSYGAASTVWMLTQPNAPLIDRPVLIAGPADAHSQLRDLAAVLALSPRGLRALEAAFQRRFGMPPTDVVFSQAAAALHGPGLIVHDHNDRRVPFSHGERIAAAWPKARLLATKGNGHNQILRDPAVIEQVVDFVRAGAYVTA